MISSNISVILARNPTPSRSHVCLFPSNYPCVSLLVAVSLSFVRNVKPRGDNDWKFLQHMPPRPHQVGPS
jgi:hypothetical protein